MTDDLIEYIPRTYIKDVEKEMKIMNKIKRERQLTEATKGDVGSHYVDQYNNNQLILSVIITPGNRLIPHYEYRFTFNLYIPSWRPYNLPAFSREIGQHHRSRSRHKYQNIPSYQMQRIFLKYSFTANHENIKRIHTTITYKMNTSGHHYFATKPYPKRMNVHQYPLHILAHLRNVMLCGFAVVSDIIFSTGKDCGKKKKIRENQSQNR